MLGGLGVILVKEDTDGGGERAGEAERDEKLKPGQIIRFDPPKAWKAKLELSAALKVVYALFGGERRVVKFLGTEEKSSWLCCFG